MTEPRHATIYLAIEADDLESVEAFLERGASDFLKEEALGFAAQGGHTKVIELLLRRGVDIDARDFFNASAYQKAVLAEKTETAELLREKGADATFLYRCEACGQQVTGADIESGEATLHPDKEQVTCNACVEKEGRGEPVRSSLNPEAPPAPPPSGFSWSPGRGLLRAAVIAIPVFFFARAKNPGSEPDWGFLVLALVVSVAVLGFKWPSDGEAR